MNLEALEKLAKGAMPGPWRNETILKLIEIIKAWDEGAHHHDCDACDKGYEAMRKIYEKKRSAKRTRMSCETP